MRLQCCTDGVAVSTFSAQGRAGRSQTPPVTKHVKAHTLFPAGCEKSPDIPSFSAKVPTEEHFLFEHPGGFDCTINWRDS